MNREDVIRMAREARLAEHTHPYQLWSASDDGLERFAALVYTEGHKDGLDDFEAGVLPAAIAAEREACAKVCDEKVEAEYATGKVDHNEMGWTQACAITIRARGQG
jgi:hypothetical protein